MIPKKLSQVLNVAKGLLPHSSVYFIDEHGLPCRKKNDEPQRLSNFLPIPVNDVVRSNGRYEERFLEVEGILYKGQFGYQYLDKINISISEFLKMEWHLKWGLSAKIEPGPSVKDNLRAFIQDLSGNIPRVLVFTNIGWVYADGAYHYIHAGGVIGNSSVSTDPDPFLQNYNLSSEINDSQKAAKVSFSLLSVGKPRVTIPLMSIIFLSPLLEALRPANLEPKFILWLSGTTGTFKTTTSLAFLNHFGQFSSPPASFKDTYNSLEKKGFLTKDSLLLLDDFHPTSSTKESNSMSDLSQKNSSGLWR